MKISMFFRNFIFLTLILKSSLYPNSILFMEPNKEKKVLISEDRKLSKDMSNVTIIYDDNFETPNTDNYVAAMSLSPFLLGPYHPKTQFMLGYYYCKFSPYKDLILNKLSNKKEVIVITRTTDGTVRIVYLDSSYLKDNK